MKGIGTQVSIEALQAVSFSCECAQLVRANVHQAMEVHRVNANEHSASQDNTVLVTLYKWL